MPGPPYPLSLAVWLTPTLTYISLAASSRQVRSPEHPPGRERERAVHHAALIGGDTAARGDGRVERRDDAARVADLVRGRREGGVDRRDVSGMDGKLAAEPEPAGPGGLLAGAVRVGQ